MDKTKKGRDYIIESAGSLAISTGEWKYIQPGKKDAENGTQGQLFWLKQDVGEKENVIGEYPEIADSLKCLLNMEICEDK